MAIQLVPVSASSDGSGTLTLGPGVKPLPPGDGGVPKTLADLTGGEQAFSTMVSASLAMSLGFSVGSLSASAATQLYVSDFLVYKDVTDAQGHKARYGVGTRILIAISILNASANVSSVPFIAASAQMSSVSATASFDAPGLVSEAITKAIPQNGTFDSTMMVIYQIADSKIRGLIHDPSTTVTPQLLWTTADVSNTDYEAVMAQAWALEQIRVGHTMLSAQTKHNDSTNHFKDVVRATYVDVAGITDPSATPSDLAQAKAKALQLGYRVDS